MDKEQAVELLRSLGSQNLCEIADFIEQQEKGLTELREFKCKYDNYVMLQHGRNYDDDEAERKLNMLADQHKELQHKFNCMRLAVIAQNSKEDDDNVHYCYVPFDDDYNSLKSLADEVIVHIPVVWLKEMISQEKYAELGRLAIEAIEKDKTYFDCEFRVMFGDCISSPGCKWFKVCQKRAELMEVDKNENHSS